MDILSNAYVSKFVEGSSLLAVYEEGLAARVFEALWASYPKYNWRVKVDARPTHGLVSVQLPQLHHSTLGFNFPISKLDGDPGMGIVKKAGGEMLERFKLRRGAANKAEFREAIYRKRVHKIGDHIDGGLANELKARMFNHIDKAPKILVPANENEWRKALAA